jgi:hypothetical protein
VSAATGRAGVSGDGLIPGVALAAPVVVPSAWGDRNDALVIVSTPCPGTGGAGTVSAWSVGNNGATGDDDTTDDDGAATTGFVWTLALPDDAGGVASRGTAFLDDGRVMVLASCGDAVVIGGAHAAVEIASPAVEASIIAGVAVATITAFAAAFMWARRERAAAAALAAAEEAGADAVAGGSGDDDDEDDGGAPLLGAEAVVFPAPRAGAGGGGSVQVGT